MDGFSINNIRLTKESTSAQMAAQAEQLSHKGLEFKIRDIGELARQKGIVRKEDENKQDGNFNDGLQERENNEEEDAPKQSLNEKFFDQNDPKEFSVRINPNTEMIELFNNRDRKVVETISAADLMELISKLDSASGVLVNKRI